jgi:hypothetical protein
MMDFIKAGDFVTRYLGGIPMQLRVTKVTDKLIICGGDETDHVGYWFDIVTGVEIDEEIGWGPQFGVSGSYIEAGDGPFVPPTL